MKGYYQKLLDINLSTKKIRDYIIPEEYLRYYMGGKGLGARILWDRLKPGVDPLGPENVMVILTGPITGHNVMGQSRYVVMTRSPLSKFVAESYGGGFFGASLKSTGYDGIIITGAASTPLYLQIVDDKIELKDASEFWGKGVFETHNQLVKRYGKKARTAIIGVAGENLVRYAAIINDKSRAAARGGPGAVLGSKKLKAIVVRGNKKTTLANPQKFKETNKKWRSRLVDDMKMRDGFGVLGTSGAPPALSNLGILPTKNFQFGSFDDAERIGGQFMKDIGLVVGRDTCSSCLAYCKRKLTGDYKGYKLVEDGSSLEYETLASFGSLLLNNDVKLSAVANQFCNDLGLDTISAGVSLAFAMEATESGLSDELGVHLDWGNEEQIIDALQFIAKRESYGNVLAEGTMRMAEKIGSTQFAMHAKGLEIAMHEPRGKVGLGISYATSPRGGSHMEGFHDSMVARENANPEFGAVQALSVYDHKGKAPLVVNFENATSFSNSMILCAFNVQKTGKYNNLPLMLELLESITGMQLTIADLLKTGERIYNMWRMVAVREGLTNKDDDLPERFKVEQLDYGDAGQNAVTPEKLTYMLKEYYQIRGWKEDGTVDEETIKRLNLPA